MALPARDEAREQLSDHDLRLQRIEEIVGRTEGAVHDLQERVGRLDERIGRLEGQVVELRSDVNANTESLASTVKILRAIGDHLGVKFPPSKLD